MPSRRKRQRVGSRRRRIVLWVLAGLFLVVVALGLLAIPLLKVPGDAQAANSDLTAAMTALKKGDVDSARSSVTSARRHIDDAQDGALSLGGRIWSAIPYVGTPVADVRHLVQALDDVTSVADVAVRLYPSVAGPDATLFRDQQIDQGTLDDVLAGVHTAGTHLLSAQSELDDVQGDTPFIGARIAARRDAAAAKVDPMADGYTRARPMLEAFPSLFGFEGRRRYLVAMLNPAELRYSGGAPLAYAPMTWDDGTLTVGKAFSVVEDPRFGHDVTWKGVHGNPFHRRHTRITSATFAPSWSVSGEELIRGWRTYTGERFDGVMAVDVVTMAQLLAVTGPTSVPGLGEISADNVLHLLSGNYDAYYPDASASERTSASAIVGSLQGLLFSGGDYVAKGRALKTAADGRHLAVYFKDDDLEEGAAALGLDGDLGSAEGDYLGVFTQALVGTKVDYYQRRTISLDVTLDQHGTASDQLDVVLDNDTPPYVAAPLPDPKSGYFTRWSTLAATTFLPSDAELDSATLGGEPGPQTARRFYDHSYVFQRTVIPPGQTSALQATYSVPGAATVSDSGSMTYHLSMDPQATVHPATTKVTLHLPSGYEASSVPEGWTVDGSTVTFQTTSLQSEDWEITLTPTD